MTVTKTVNKVLNSKTIGLGDIVGGAIGAWSVYSSYKQNRMEGRGVLSSGISAAGSALMYNAVGPLGMAGLTLLKEGPQLAVNTALKLDQISRTASRSNSSNMLFNNATFIDTKQAFTMRQAGMQLAENSKYNMQQYMMGNEASAMHKL